MFISNSRLVKVTQKQLEKILLNLDDKSARFAKILQCTSPKTLVKCRDTKEAFNSNLRKLTALSVILNSDYAKGVKRQLERENKPETDYKAGTNRMIIDKSNSNNNFCGTFYGKVVIEYRPFENSYAKTKFICDGKITAKNKIPNVLPKPKKAQNQGTDKEIIWRKLYAKNIAKIKINGTIYKNIDCKI